MGLGGIVMSDALRLPDEGKDDYFTYGDYLEWDGPERYEIINGGAFMMSSPLVVRQAVSGEIYRQIANFLLGKPCRVFAAPLDVRLFPEDDKSDDTVVQPDILVVCDESKISKGSIDGPPDLVIEVVSPSNTHKLMLLKLQAYIKAGVREYWVLEPEEKRVQVYILEEGRYISSAYSNDDIVPVSVLPPFSLELKSVWE
jgi:Uma2 family endonuclease